MTTSDQEDQAEKRRVTLQDVDVRQQQQTSTFHQHALSQADEISGGRFRAARLGLLGRWSSSQHLIVRVRPRSVTRAQALPTVRQMNAGAMIRR